MTGVSLGRGLDSKLYHRILGADLDAYFGGAYTAALNRDTGKLDVKYGSQTVGGERMERVMDAVKNQSVEILAGKLGLKPEDVKMRMMTDGQGDPEGYYVADITTGGRTETVRLASKKGLLGTDGTKVRILNGEGVWEETDYGTLLARIKKGLGEFGQKAQKTERPNAGYYGR